MRNLAALILSVVGVIGLVACGEDGGEAPLARARTGNLLVYEGRQSVQCGTRGLTTQQSAQKLIDGGIDVIESNCGVITGVAFAAVCGGGTGEILLHEIRSVNLADAEQRGFKAASTLTDRASGVDYAKVDCQTGVALP
jgi:hypothetical protein